MGLLAETSYSNNGVPKKDFANAFQQLNNQARIIEQKLVMKVDNEIMNNFNSRKQEVISVKEGIYKLTTPYKKTIPVQPYALGHAKGLSFSKSKRSHN